MRSVIWDLGGTLLNTYPDVDRTLCEAVHGDVTDEHMVEVARLTRVSSGHAIEELSRRYGVPASRLREAYDELKERWRDEPAPLMDGAREVMDAVAADSELNLVATHRDRDSATVLLDGLSLMVDDMVCAPDGHPRKPDPTMIELLLQRHQLAAAECVAVGDRPADVEAALAAGVPGVLLETPGIPLQAPAGARRITALEQLRSA